MTFTLTMIVSISNQSLVRDEGSSMRAHVRWTPELDGQLCRLRLAGVTWDGIAATMSLGRNTVLERGRKIGARRSKPVPLRAESEARDRAPRQAGHPATWELITAGTLLEGECYPYPVFLYERIMNSKAAGAAAEHLACDEPAVRLEKISGEARTSRGAVDSEFIIYRLEEAGATLLSLPASGYSTRLKVSHLEVVHEIREAYGWASGNVRPAVPSASRITRMDEALGWITLIPKDRYVLRRIVGARSLVSPVTERHLFSWRRLGGVMGADHKAVQRWHSKGIDILVAAVSALTGGEGVLVRP